jgi:hypothetical protein
MKKLSFILILVALAITSCSKLDVDAENAVYIKENAESVIGKIDPNQDWNSLTTGTVSVTADASLKDIAKVQILTESPFFNPNARVLAEAEVSKGQTVTLRYDAPNTAKRLIAACVDKDGHYYAKGFDLSQQSISFRDNTTRAARRASDYPSQQQLKLETKNVERSYNAQRTRFVNEAYASNNTAMKAVVSNGNIGAWYNAGWENEHLWHATDNNNTGTSWKIANSAIVRDIDAMTADEETMLRDLFGDFLTRKIGKLRVDNRELIRNSDIVKLYNNHLTSDGSTPITVSPIFMASTEIGNCNLYYYYYNPDNMNGMEEADYIKTLPKFKAIQCSYTRSAANTAGKGQEDLFKVHEYMLPYYGEPETFMPQIVHATDHGTFGQTIYRIRNEQPLNGAYYYMVNTNDDNKKLATKYEESDPKLNNQLWQVYTTTDGYKALYNLGTHKFLVWDGDWATTYSDDFNKMKSCLYRFESIGENKYHFWRYNNNGKGLGTDLTKKANNFRIATNKGLSDGANFEWTLEEYNGSSNLAAVSDFEFEQYQQATITSPSLAIPKGYRIGFMLKKKKDVGPYVDGFRDITDAGHGCCYGFGTLNKEINTLTGHFATSTTGYTMEADDPRACYITANGVTYIGFEDGADCQYNDIILEICGYDQEVLEEEPRPIRTNSMGAGIQVSMLYDLEEREGYPYTLCFEDRPITADYDMNDVVLRCVRKSGEYRDKVDLSLVACGGDDDVWIIIDTNYGEFQYGFPLTTMEVHELFQVGRDDVGHRFINTQANKLFEAPRTAVYKLKDGVTVPEFLSHISIVNRTTGQSVSVATAGDSPTGVIIPGQFNYPMEAQRITNVYEIFSSWAGNSSDPEFKEWYEHANSQMTIKMNEVFGGR